MRGITKRKAPAIANAPACKACNRPSPRNPPGDGRRRSLLRPRLDPRLLCQRLHPIRHARQGPMALSTSPMISSRPCYAPPSPWRSATEVPSCRTWPRPCEARSLATGRCIGWSHRRSGNTTTRRSCRHLRGGDGDSNSRAIGRGRSLHCPDPDRRGPAHAAAQDRRLPVRLPRVGRLLRADQRPGAGCRAQRSVSVCRTGCSAAPTRQLSTIKLVRPSGREDLAEMAVTTGPREPAPVEPVYCAPKASEICIDARRR
jgi:hypothetical protein